MANLPKRVIGKVLKPHVRVRSFGKGKVREGWGKVLWVTAL